MPYEAPQRRRRPLLHTAVRCTADDRQALEHLYRYVPRPALSGERVQLNNASQVELKLETPWRDRTTHLLMSRLEIIKWLAAPQPQPRSRLRPRMSGLRRPILALGCPLRVAGPHERQVTGAQPHAIGLPYCGHWWATPHAAYLSQTFPPPMSAM